ncbi:hypothetical protein D3C85_1464640 [compost metagenome]
MKKLILHGGIERRQQRRRNAARRQAVGAVGPQHGTRQAEETGKHQPMPLNLSLDLHP